MNSGVFEKIVNGELTCSLCRRRFKEKGRDVCEECDQIAGSLFLGNRCEVCGEFSLKCRLYAGEEINESIDGNLHVGSDDIQILKSYMLCPHCADRMERYVIEKRHLNKTGYLHARKK